MFTLTILLELSLMLNLRIIFSLIMVTSSLLIISRMTKKCKILKSKDVIFNEDVMCKDRLNKKLENPSTEGKKQEVVLLKDFAINDMQDNDHEDQEYIAPKVEPQMLVFEPRRSSRTIRAPQRYSLLLHYILLTDSGE
ncbi:hypothetical protein Pint_04529 [Pistacia integerrima]|uniref:Uncharacterized protein n=1 Tax=Pistacia integerrima TaxID=434235 RepID=A0ACC0Z4G9_9ROSI|nr:hypothetical protein Pint_04529 [Pistacia integerrima]